MYKNSPLFLCCATGGAAGLALFLVHICAQQPPHSPAAPVRPHSWKAV